MEYTPPGYWKRQVLEHRARVSDLEKKIEELEKALALWQSFAAELLRQVD